MASNGIRAVASLQQSTAISRNRAITPGSSDQLVLPTETKAVLQLMSHFKSYRSVDQIAHLSRSISTLRQSLETQITQDFHTTFPTPPPAQIPMLHESCLVIDVLGEEPRDRLVTWYCNLQLKEYRHVFRGNEEAGGLDNISRRYAWLRRILGVYDEDHAAIFPVYWKVNEVLCKAFCDTTRFGLIF